MAKIQKNVSLKNYTTFKIGGPAKYFFIAKSKEDLIEAVRFAKQKGLPFFILGGGSNLLVADEGYDGMVIKIQNSKFEIQNENAKCKIFCEAGVKLKDLVELSLENDLTGLEWAAGIPRATVGGAVRGNAGAFGSSIGDVVEEVECVEVEPLGEVRPPKIRTFNNKNCQFSYKETIFKKNKNLIILSCVLQLKKGDKKGIKQKIKYFSDYRKKNHPMEFLSAGSVFKNPPKIPAGELIEKCGLKGKRIGAAQVSTKHANFIVNLGKATSGDVIQLINLIKNKVKNKFGVELKEEIQFLGS